MLILIDNGHGIQTKGKRSPDGRLKEYSYCRQIANEIVRRLQQNGYDCRLLVPEVDDISLKERVRRVNEYCNQYGNKNVVLISVHNNAAGNGLNWKNARGWTGWIAKNHSKQSEQLAQLLYAEAENLNLKGNRSVPKCKYWMADYYILKNSKCPAVLTENLFQDNLEDVNFLLSMHGRERIIDLHLKGIINYVENVII